MNFGMIHFVCDAHLHLFVLPCVSFFHYEIVTCSDDTLGSTNIFNSTEMPHKLDKKVFQT